MNKEIIKLEIPHQADRDNLISALANSGYKVWVEEEFDENKIESIHHIFFEDK